MQRGVTYYVATHIMHSYCTNRETYYAILHIMLAICVGGVVMRLANGREPPRQAQRVLFTPNCDTAHQTPGCQVEVQTI
jgi:hypothetical protein